MSPMEREMSERFQHGVRPPFTLEDRCMDWPTELEAGLPRWMARAIRAEQIGLVTDLVSGWVSTSRTTRRLYQHRNRRGRHVEPRGRAA
jgi:hypothetical protein